MSLDNITLDGVSLASAAPCSSGKVQHKDKASAEAHALSIQQKDGHLPNVFVCAECGFFHVGGGRKSDRPAYLQPSRIPVLPPAKLPRKEYQRRKIEEGVSYEVRDVVVEYYQAHAAATDNDVAKHFGLSHDEVYAIRRAAGVGTKSQRSTAKVLAQLRLTPAMPRKELAALCGVSFEQVCNILYTSAEFKHSGHQGIRKGTPSPLEGIHLSEERKQKMSAAQKRRAAHPDYRAHLAKIRIKANLAFAEWAKRNPLKQRQKITPAHSRLMAHMHHHVKRGIVKAGCPLCAAQVSASQ